MKEGSPRGTALRQVRGDTFGAAAASRVRVTGHRSLPVPGDYNSQEASRAARPPPGAPALAAMQM